jgi:hypothetical protein
MKHAGNHVSHVSALLRAAHGQTLARAPRRRDTAPPVDPMCTVELPEVVVAI